MRWLVLGALGAALVLGASRLAFLCDDAFIHFRYAANAHAGHGLVWNPAPFAPVEGYGFLWVVILWGIWAATGVEPPVAANPFSIACGLVQLLLLAAALRRLTWRDGRRLPEFVGWLALAVVVGNRTFLQWLSSGLDTALFNMWLLAWVLHAFRPAAARTTRWLMVWSALAALAALTRPDGLPLVGATAGVAVLRVWRRATTWRATVCGLLPLLAIVAHLVWRHDYYGEWLPNTYFAKVVAAWPEAGLRYFACFAVENGAWLWFPILGLWLIAELRRPLRGTIAALLDHAPAFAAVAVALFNACYYLFQVGGDHFEYRVLSSTVPLGVLACVAMVARLAKGLRWPLATVSALGLAGCVGWVHLALTSAPDRFGVQAVTPAVPAFCQPLARWFDRQQLWLFVRYIGLRCNHHASVLALYHRSYPERRSIATAADPFPVIATGAVGLPSWYLPDCAVVDEFGLNDWVIARTPSSIDEPLRAIGMRAAAEAADTDRNGLLDLIELRSACATAFGTNAGDAGGDFLLQFLIEVYQSERPGLVTSADAESMAEILNAGRRMAHERKPPPGYVQAFDPNVTVVNGAISVRQRATPLTADRIRAIEAEWRSRVRAGRLGP